MCGGVAGNCDECIDENDRIVDYDLTPYVTDKTGKACIPKNDKVHGMFLPSASGTKKFEACLTGCKKCADEHTCIECENPLASPTYYLDKTGTPHQCVECNQNDKYKANGECLPCGTNCDVCSDATTCTTCKDTSTMSVLENTSPQECALCTPIPNRYLEGNICKECPTQCAACSSAAACASCKNNDLYLNLDKLTCSASCPTGEYEKAGVKECEKCPNHCSDCTSATECSGCSENTKYLQPDKFTCDINCPSNTFKNEATMTCDACPTGCSSCLSLTECTGCTKTKHFLHPDKITCSQECPDGFMKNTENMTCERSSCSNNCKVDKT